jgi:hypothetical protein
MAVLFKSNKLFNFMGYEFTYKRMAVHKNAINIWRLPVNNIFFMRKLLISDSSVKLFGKYLRFGF